MRWSVYRIIPSPKQKAKTPTIEALGYVNAPHSGMALLAAFKRWADKVDNGQVQGGFSVRVYATDTMSLGKLAKPGND